MPNPRPLALATLLVWLALPAAGDAQDLATAMANGLFGPAPQVAPAEAAPASTLPASASPAVATPVDATTAAVPSPTDAPVQPAAPQTMPQAVPQEWRAPSDSPLSRVSELVRGTALAAGLTAGIFGADPLGDAAQTIGTLGSDESGHGHGHGH